MKYLLSVFLLISGCNSSLKNAYTDPLKVGECYYKHEIGESEGAMIIQLGQYELMYYIVQSTDAQKILTEKNSILFRGTLGIFVNSYQFQRACPKR